MASAASDRKGANIGEIWIFDDTFYKKGPVLVILVPGMIQLLGSGSSLII